MLAYCQFIHTTLSCMFKWVITYIHVSANKGFLRDTIGYIKQIQWIILLWVNVDLACELQNLQNPALNCVIGPTISVTNSNLILYIALTSVNSKYMTCNIHRSISSTLALLYTMITILHLYMHFELPYFFSNSATDQLLRMFKNHSVFVVYSRSYLGLSEGVIVFQTHAILPC